MTLMVGNTFRDIYLVDMERKQGKIKVEPEETKKLHACCIHQTSEGVESSICRSI